MRVESFGIKVGVIRTNVLNKIVTKYISEMDSCNKFIFLLSLRNLHRLQGCL